MVTEDILLPMDGSWVGIPKTSTHTILFNGSGIECYVRFGAGSTSYGMKLEVDDTIVVDETVYVRPIHAYENSGGSLRVTR